MENQIKTSNQQSVCEKLITEVNQASSLNELKLISDKADALFWTDDNQEIRLQMTDDFWIQFTEVIRKRFNQLNEH